MSLDLADPKPQADLLAPLRGDWLTRPRLTVGLMVCLALTCAAFYPILRGTDGIYDTYGRLLGADFAPFWAAGKAALAVEAARPYRLDWFLSFLKEVFGPDSGKFAWNYPPMLFFLVTPLALLPYGAALALWLGTAYAALVAVVRSMLGPVARHPLFWLAVIAFPGIYGNGVQGQSAFLVAALIGGALLLLERRPVLSGLLLALLAFKPQFGILVPLALIAGGHWRTFASAAVFCSLIFLLTGLVFGWDVWWSFAAGLDEAREQILDRGRAGFHLFNSPYGVLRNYGVPAGPAYIAQFAVTALLILAIWRLWRSEADQRLKSAALIAASLLATPYCIDYDLVILAPAIALCVSHGIEKGFAPWAHTVLALAFIVSPLARFSSFFLLFPLGLMATASLFTISLLQALAPEQKGQARA